MNIKRLILLSFILIVMPDYAYGGGVIIDGTDSIEHGMKSGGKNQGGWLYIQKVLDLLARTVPSNAKHRVVVLGVSKTSSSGEALISAYDLSTLKDNEWEPEPKFVDGEDEIDAWLKDISIENTGILLIPTFGHLIDDIEPIEMAVINSHAGAIADFSNGATNQGMGGALFAMGETSKDSEGNDPFKWLAALFPSITVTDLEEQGVNTVIQLTKEGEAILPGLPPSELAMNRPWHNYFEGNFTGLQVLGRAQQPLPDSTLALRNIILASRVSTADLSVEFILQSDSVVGFETSYTIRIFNEGPDAATSVTVKVTLPPSVIFVSSSSSGDCAASGNEVIATYGLIPAGAAEVLTVVARIACGVANNTLLSASVAVESSTPDSRAENNFAVATARARVLPPEVVGSSTIDFDPVNAKRKPPKRPQAGSFTIVNRGLCEIAVRVVTINRVGPDVDSGNIINPEPNGCRNKKGDCKIFSITENERILAPGEPVLFNVLFKPAIPAFTILTSGLPSHLVLPANFTSDLILAEEGGASVTIKLKGHIIPSVVLIDPNDLTRPPVASLTRAGDEFSVEFTVYDASPEDLQSAKYEFLDINGQVKRTITVDQGLRSSISQRLQQGDLIRGRSFKVRSRFSAAKDHPEIARVRVTVNGRASNGTVITSASNLSAAPTGPRRRRARPRPLAVPTVKLEFAP